MYVSREPTDYYALDSKLKSDKFRIQNTETM